jgi:hypothetical protein
LNARRRSSVDSYEKFLDFLVDFDFLKKVVDKTKKDFFVDPLIFLLFIFPNG